MKKMKRFKKFVALGTTMAMVAAMTPMTAFAELTGGGGIEDFLDTHVYAVSVPTDPSGNALDFIIDPQGLLYVQDSIIYGSFQDGTALVFNNYDMGYTDTDMSADTDYQLATGTFYTDGSVWLTEDDYCCLADKTGFAEETDPVYELVAPLGTPSDTSDTFTVVNKSTYDVEVTYDLTLANLTSDDATYPYEINMVDSIPGTETTDIAFGVALDGGTPEYVAEDGTCSVSTVLTGSSSNYEFSYDGVGDAYDYAINADKSTVTFDKVDLTMTGDVNTTGDWTNFTENPATGITSTIAWTIEEVVNEAATITEGTVSDFYTADAPTGGADLATYTLGSGSFEAEDISVTENGDTLDPANYTTTDSTVTLTEAYLNTLTAGDYSYVITIENSGNGAITPVVSSAIEFSITNANVAPTFSTGTVGKITYTAGSGTLALASITYIKMTNTSGTAYDGYHAYGSTWSAATDASGTITFDSRYLAFYTGTKVATVTYVNSAGATQTATVNVITH